MSRSDQLSMYRTTIQTEDGITSIRYAQTTIVGFDPERVILRTGGWKTVTTKRKMNQASRQFGLGFAVYQKNHEWFLRVFARDNWERWDEAATEFPFDHDSLVINRKTRDLSL